MISTSKHLYNNRKILVFIQNVSQKFDTEKICTRIFALNGFLCLMSYQPSWVIWYCSHPCWRTQWYNLTHSLGDESFRYLSQVSIIAQREFELLCLDSYFSFLSRGIILWIELPWPENPANTYAWHTGILDSCFDLIRSHQHCLPWSPPLEIEPATTDCKDDSVVDITVYTADEK